MRVIKLPWLNHTVENRKFEVYSLSISSDGTRLASGGLDGKVRIWSIDTILKFNAPEKSKYFQSDQQNSIDETLHRPLCSMARHNGAVTVVRFDPLGRFLASGSDDKILLIWEKDEEAITKTFGQKDTDVDLEHWTVRKRVVAHDNDIQDMAWAPDSSILVTVGLDRSIVVWNGNTFEKIKRFDIHQSLVKGIVFDPAGKYFATASDDRTVRIFRYHKTSPTEMTFSVEYVCVDPFRKSPLTSYFRRCSWSPDGQYIAAPNATNGPVASVAVISRGSWESNVSLIGHDTPCEVVSFSPRLFELQDGKESQLSSILATGGQDKALAIWNTARSRPLVVLNEICNKTITDLAWTPDGEKIFVSSLDGTITLVAFELKELGTPVSLDVNDLQLHRYGADRDSMAVPENTQQLLLEEIAETESKRKNNYMLMTKMDAPKTENVFDLPSSPKIKDQPPLTGSPSLKGVLSKLKQRVVITKDGRKRVSPMLISTARPIPKSTQVSLAKSDRIAKEITKNLLSRSAYTLPRFGIPTCVAGLRDANSLSLKEETEGLQADMIDETGAPPAKSYRDRPRVPEYLADVALLLQTVLDVKLRPKVMVVVAQGGGSVLEVRNGTAIALNGPEDAELETEEDDDEPTEVISNDSAGNRKFQAFFPSVVVHAVGFQGKFWALALANGHLALLSPEGAMLCPSIYLGVAPIAVLKCTEHFILAVANDARVYVWDLASFKVVYHNVSLAPVLNAQAVYQDAKKVQVVAPFEPIKAVELTQEGVPIVVTHNQEVFAWSGEMKTWTKIADPWFYRIADLSGDCVGKDIGSGMVRVINDRCRRGVEVTYREDDPEFLAATRAAFRETVNCAARILGSEIGGDLRIIDELRGANTSTC
ncbi:hypothetical protein BABINDRAFT_162844, partial [Babjeviella inositovora NRRL Y-12698]